MGRKRIVIALDLLQIFFVLLTSVYFLTLPALAAEHKPVPAPGKVTEMTFDSLRGVLYAEIWMGVGTPETGLAGHYFNTSGLNNTADKMDTCPPSVWDKVNAEKLKNEFNAYFVFKNGPRGWTMDSIRIPVGPVETFDGIQARWWGKGELAKGIDFKDGLEPYKPLRSYRKSSMTFEKGKSVFILEDKEGTPWIMQAFSKIKDPSLTYDSLKTLGDRLKPAEGWKYRVVIIDKDLTITTPQDYAWIVQDELGNTYDACKDGTSNYKP